MACTRPANRSRRRRPRWPRRPHSRTNAVSPKSVPGHRTAPCYGPDRSVRAGSGSDMRQNRSCRNGRPIKLSNRSGSTIQNFYTSEQMTAIDENARFAAGCHKGLACSHLERRALHPEGARLREGLHLAANGDLRQVSLSARSGRAGEMSNEGCRSYRTEGVLGGLTLQMGRASCLKALMLNEPRTLRAVEPGSASLAITLG